VACDAEAQCQMRAWAALARRSGSEAGGGDPAFYRVCCSEEVVGHLPLSGTFKCDVEVLSVDDASAGL
jgi:hypothetical protein